MKTLEKFIALAKKNTLESWGQIDARLSHFRNDELLLVWARENIFNGSSELRDLSATIFEASDTVLTFEDIKNLLQLMIIDTGYPSFRAACALGKRYNVANVKPFMRSVSKKLMDFLDDKDVAEIAKKYLDVIGGEK